jgi:2-polyprenyl-3-methyl-5-hydroxy-6-metoxy-1,4-benzoquinol methylase
MHAPDDPLFSSGLPPWKTCLDLESQDADHYLDFWNQPLFDIINQEPRRVLELGCAGGMFGAKLKERYPAAAVIGVEANRGAAAKAATRLDRVICSRLEALDFPAAGLQPGEIDLVIAADVLEHLVNPWDLLVKLKPYLSKDAVIAASIPNVRNIELVSGLLQEGNWEYAERGLLDITHLRFFTFDGIRQMFETTGYAIEGFAMTLLPSLAETYKHNKGREAVTIRIGRLTFENISQRELGELCAEQFLLRVRPA